jgi:hypothetical protein
VPATVDFEERYRSAFDGLHLKLAPGDACSAEELDAVERSLGISIPASLRSYFRVAGGWTHVGETNGMHAFVRSGVALCWLRWDDDWRIFIAGANYADVERLSESLSVTWDRNYE